LHRLAAAALGADDEGNRDENEAIRQSKFTPIKM